MAVTDLKEEVCSCPLLVFRKISKGNFLNKYHDNIFKLFLIKWTKTVKAGGNSNVKTFSAKKRKLNYMIHNPNTVEDTAKMLLDILVRANEKKVERKLQELADYDALIDQKADKSRKMTDKKLINIS